MDPPISELKYELVVLHPEHFLPNGNDLTIFHRTNGQLDKKSYAIGPDRTLRESPGTGDSGRLPPFSFDLREAKSTAVLRDLLDTDDVSSPSLSEDEDISEFGARDGEAAGSTDKQPNAGFARRWPDNNGSLEGRRDYMQYLLSGHG